MTNLTLYTTINTLPSNLKNDVWLFIQNLIEKNKKTKSKRTHPKAGCMKGTFKISDDFNAPIDDFKEYM